MTQVDLDDYRVRVQPALQGTYRGRRVYTSHAPTSGPVLLHMLNLAEMYELNEMNGLNVHRLVEIMKFGFAARYVPLEFQLTVTCHPDSLTQRQNQDLRPILHGLDQSN